MKEKVQAPELRFDGFTDDWEERKFFESIASTIDFRGRTPKKLGMDWSDSGYLALSALNVKNGYIDYDAGLDYVEEDEFRRMYKRCNPEKGDILISCSGTIGRVTQIKTDEKFVLVRSAALVKPNSEFINSTYLEYYLQSDFMQREMLKNANIDSPIPKKCSK